MNRNVAAYWFSEMAMALIMSMIVVPLSGNWGAALGIFFLMGMRAWMRRNTRESLPSLFVNGTLIGALVWGSWWVVDHWRPWERLG